MQRADELIECIVNSSRIPGARRRRELQRELRSHVEDFIVAEHAAGRDANEIEKLVLSRFGDPEQIARGFAWVYRHERRGLQALALALSTLLLATVLTAAVLAIQAGLALGFGRPVTRALASPHTIIEALDILASVAVYLSVTALESLFRRYRFQKAAMLLAASAVILNGACAAAGVHLAFPILGIVNGVLFRAVQLYVVPTPARVGIVLVCFPLIGLVAALMRAPLAPAALAATYASWFALGAGYQLMTRLAARVDAVLLSGLQRIQEGY